MKDTIQEVRPGQVYHDNYPYGGGLVRRVRVLGLEVRNGRRQVVTDPEKQGAPTHARVQGTRWHEGLNKWEDMGPQTSVKLTSFHREPRKSGYSLVQEGTNDGN